MFNREQFNIKAHKLWLALENARYEHKQEIGRDGTYFWMCDILHALESLESMDDADCEQVEQAIEAGLLKDFTVDSLEWASPICSVVIAFELTGR